MDHAVAVRGIERVPYLDGVLQHLLRRERPLFKPVREGLAFQILHDEKVHADRREDLVGAEASRGRKGHLVPFRG
jgi:hypothetical protein